MHIIPYMDGRKETTLDHSPVILHLVLAIATFGIYYFIWFLKKRPKYNKLTEKPFGVRRLLSAI